MATLEQKDYIESTKILKDPLEQLFIVTVKPHSTFTPFYISNAYKTTLNIT